MKINKLKIFLMAVVCTIIACSYEYGETITGPSFMEGGCKFHYNYKITNDGDEVCFWSKKDFTSSLDNTAPVCLGADSDWVLQGCMPRNTFENGGPFTHGGYTFWFHKGKIEFEKNESLAAVVPPSAVSLDNCDLSKPGEQENCPIKVPNLGQLGENLMNQDWINQQAGAVSEEPANDSTPSEPAKDLPVGNLEPVHGSDLPPHGTLPNEPQHVDPLGNHMELVHPGAKPGNEINAR